MEENEIPKWEDLPKQTREFTSFLDLIIDETIESFNTEFTPTYIRCFKKKCQGTIETRMAENLEDVLWRCTRCPASGTITGVFD